MASASAGPTDWVTAQNKCIYCGESDFVKEFGPRTFIECVCCQDLGCHIECEQAATGVELDQETVESEQYEYFCSKVSSIPPPPAGVIQNSAQQSLFPGRGAALSQAGSVILPDWRHSAHCCGRRSASMCTAASTGGRGSVSNRTATTASSSLSMPWETRVSNPSLCSSLRPSHAQPLPLVTSQP